MLHYVGIWMAENVASQLVSTNYVGNIPTSEIPYVFI